jgi:adenylate cyclase
VALAAGAAGLLLWVTPPGIALEERLGHYVLFHLRGPLPAPPEIVVVGQDRAAAESLGLPPTILRWPRHLHARAVQRLTALGATVIAFDLLFSTADPVDDEAFADALRRAGAVVLLGGLERRISGGDGGASIAIDQPIDPIPVLAEAATAIAHFPLPKVPARVDRYWTFYGVAGLPTLPAVALQVAARDLAIPWAALLAADPALPRSAVEDWSGPAVVAAMQALHAALRARPQSAEGLRERLRRSVLGEVERRRLAALVALYSGEDSRYLNFRGPAGSVRTLTYAALLADPPEQAGAAIGDLSGKIVFIGVSERASSNQRDAYDTVFSGTDGINITGVEIAATAYADLAQGTSPERSSAGAAAVFFVVALALGAVAATRQMLVLLGAGAAFAAAILAAGWYAFLAHSWILPVAGPVLLQIPAALLAAAWCLRNEESRRRERMAGAARQYLPDEVVRSLASGPLHGSARPAGESRFLVCLASDIEGFTSVSERLPPQRVQSILNEYFRGMFEVMQRHGGTISDISGDGVMCVWSAPGHSAASCAAALGAALELLDVVREFNHAHPDQMFPTRIGIHAGSALLGIVGGAGRYASTIVGDVANTASRIETLNKHLGTRLLASGEVFDQVSGFAFRHMGEFLLAGKSEAIRVAEVLGPGGEPRAAALATSFAKGFAAFQSRHWDEAAIAFEALLRHYPEDGPSAYFLSQALQRRAAPGDAADRLVSHIDRK